MTQAEINELYKKIATDFKLATRKTGLWDLPCCYNVLHDIKKCMTFNYLEGVSLTINDVNGLPLKAKKYLIFSINDSEKNDRPGSIDWEDGDGMSLQAILIYNENYNELSLEERVNFIKENLKSTWYPNGVNTDFPHLQGVMSKNYTHENIKINRIDFN